MPSAQDLLTQFLLQEYEKNRARHITFWARRWRISVGDVTALLRGTKRLSETDTQILKDLPCSLAEYRAEQADARDWVAEQLRPMFNGLRLCPGCSTVLERIEWEDHECPPQIQPLPGAPQDTRGRENAKIEMICQQGAPDWPPLFFGGGLPTLGKRR